MSKICFLIDENTTRAIANQLRRLQPNITIINVGDYQAPSLGQSDPEILLWLETEDYCLITNNRRTMPNHLKEHLESGHHVPGIFILRPGASLGQIIGELLLIWEASSKNEYRDRIVYIPF